MPGDEVPPFPKTYLIVPYEHKDRAKKLGAKWDNDAKKWFADTAEAYYDLEEWHPANPTPGLTAKGRAESLYILSRQLKQEADAILARERAMEQRRLGGKEAKPPPSPGPAPPPPPPALNGAPGPMPSPVLVLGAMGILALCCCCSCWIFGGRLPSDDGILSRDREREKEDKEPLTVVQGLPVTDTPSRLPLMSMNDNARL